MNLQQSLVTDLSEKIARAANDLEDQADPVAWIEREFFIPETRNDPKLRGRIQLTQYQRDILNEALSKDLDGNFKYSIIIWSDIKKSAKSTLAAAVNLARAHFTEWGEFFVVANDLKQADSRVQHYLRRAIELNPKLKEIYHTRGYRTTAPSNSFIEAIPIDPSGEAGSNADMITFSELWGANEDAKQRMWSEMTIPPGKHGKAFRWVESYAGFAEESELLYNLWELGVKRGELLWPDRRYPVTGSRRHQPMELFVNREARMLCLWNTLPRNPWQTPEYYTSEEHILTPNEFLRMHRNQWVSSTETFVPMEWYDACRRDQADWPAINRENHPIIITMDAAVSGTAFGLYAGCRHPKHEDQILTLFAQKWEAHGGKKIDYQGTEEKPGPELVLRKLISEYNVIEVAYDEFQLHDMATRLKKEGLAWFRAFPQGNERLRADSTLRDIIRDRRFWHRGEVDLRDHIQNADAKIDPDDRKLRLVKRVERLDIDLAVCASMCSHELLRLNL